MAASFCVAAQRPLVLSGSSMFSALWPFDDEISICRRTHHADEATAFYAPDVLAQLIEAQLTQQRIPKRAAKVLSWDEVIKPIIAAWEARL